jgi:hypothetical protein
MDGAKTDGSKLTVQAVASPTGSDGAAAESSLRVEKLSDGDEVDDDEQVERFYALLANIRAMKRVYMPGGSDESGRRKRPRAASEPPWRPAFRLEDFEDDKTVATSSRCAKKRKGRPRRTRLLRVHGRSTAKARAFDRHIHV